jgi:hypothetical protein
MFLPFPSPRPMRRFWVWLFSVWVCAVAVVARLKCPLLLFNPSRLSGRVFLCTHLSRNHSRVFLVNKTARPIRHPCSHGRPRPCGLGDVEPNARGRALPHKTGVATSTWRCHPELTCCHSPEPSPCSHGRPRPCGLGDAEPNARGRALPHRTGVAARSYLLPDKATCCHTEVPFATRSGLWSSPQNRIGTISPCQGQSSALSQSPARTGFSLT